MQHRGGGEVWTSRGWIPTAFTVLWYPTKSRPSGLDPPGLVPSVFTELRPPCQIHLMQTKPCWKEYRVRSPSPVLESGAPHLIKKCFEDWDLV
jgi:hypothetical protein